MLNESISEDESEEIITHEGEGRSFFHEPPEFLTVKTMICEISRDMTIQHTLLNTDKYHELPLDLLFIVCFPIGNSKLFFLQNA